MFGEHLKAHQGAAQRPSDEQWLIRQSLSCWCINVRSIHLLRGLHMSEEYVVRILVCSPGAGAHCGSSTCRIKFKVTQNETDIS
jgi:hypothetical protein